jgi:hypothetical protein
MPNAGMPSTGSTFPTTAIAATDATVDKADVANGVGDAVGWQYSVAEKPGNTLFGKAMIINPH